jgi:hypothetical protein
MTMLPSLGRESVNTRTHLSVSDSVASVFVDDVVDGNATMTSQWVGPEGSRGRERARGRQTMAQLSEDASRVRERTLMGGGGQVTTATGGAAAAHTQNPLSHTVPPSTTTRSTASPTTTLTSDMRSRHQRRDRELQSPGSSSTQHRRTHSLSNGRAEESVASELQKRLKHPRQSEPAVNNWMNALTRLKMVHTLFDLSHHFI